MTFHCFASGPARLASSLALLTALTACDKPRALGDPNEILVGASTPAWAALEANIKSSLEPSTFTVRDERVFDVAHVDPAEPGWGNVRVTRQILLIGDETDPWVGDAISAHRGDAPEPPALFQVRNVWASNQLVTVLLLPDGAPPNAAQPLLPDLGHLYLRQFEEYARSRMFVTRPNEALADSLRRTAGFTLLLPQVYRYREVEPGIFEFRNDQPDPSRLIRNITVDSRLPADVEVSAETAIAWRTELGERFAYPPQITDALPESQPVEVAGASGIQVQGIWSNPPDEWPAAGPFVSRILNCPDRVFLVDAWLYAPGVSKYEYMYQLNTILESFECS